MDLHLTHTVRLPLQALISFDALNPLIVSGRPSHSGLKGGGNAAVVGLHEPENQNGEKTEAQI
jgi:hypothetical protein